MSNEKIFGVNPGETELEGLLRTTEIMQKHLDWFLPRKDSRADELFLSYNLVRHYLEKYEAVAPEKLLTYLLKYPEVAELYKRVKKISETMQYKACLAICDAGMIL